MRVLTGLAISLFVAMPALAEEPSDLVRKFYETPGLELKAEGRAFFTEPGHRNLELNDGIRQGGEEGCIDPYLPFDDTDFDHDEVMRTLKLDQVALGEEANVVATFMAEGEVHRVQWRLKKVGDTWKISDMISMAKDWALSRFGCE